jgi:hypothetical protein
LLGCFPLVSVAVQFVCPGVSGLVVFSKFIGDWGKQMENWDMHWRGRTKESGTLLVGSQALDPTQ